MDEPVGFRHGPGRKKKRERETESARRLSGSWVILVRRDSQGHFGQFLESCVVMPKPLDGNLRSVFGL